jgi:aryl-alcohol dehydrogenase-like predicted oxidoreductase
MSAGSTCRTFAEFAPSTRGTMRTVELAGSGLSASRLGFGLSGLHHLVRSRNRQILLSSAFDAGITYFDTSPYYGHGLAERELGVFASGRRQSIVIATKFGIPANPWLTQFPLLMYSRLAADAALRRLTKRQTFAVKRNYDYRGTSAVASLNRSLRALRTDHVDILYLHDPTLERMTEPDRLFDTLQGLKSQGKVRFFGLAGSARDCLAIIHRYPAQHWLVQLDAAPGPVELELFSAQSVPFQSSYGHFRDKKEPIAGLLATSVRANRDGVILFSTRRPAHINAMVRLLSTLEPN